jgi:hypothetical protein
LLPLRERHGLVGVGRGPDERQRRLLGQEIGQRVAQIGFVVGEKYADMGVETQGKWGAHEG